MCIPHQCWGETDKGKEKEEKEKEAGCQWNQSGGCKGRGRRGSGNVPTDDHQKGDGAYLYATVDLAAAKERLETLEADWLVYVTDQGQSLHFQQIFEAVQRAGWGAAAVVVVLRMLPLKPPPRSSTTWGLASSVRPDLREKVSSARVMETRSDWGHCWTKPALAPREHCG